MVRHSDTDAREELSAGRRAVSIVDMHWAELLPYGALFMQGLGMTLALSGCGFALGLVLGIVMLLAYQVPFTPLRGCLMLYTSFFRGTPMLVQALSIYYCLPALVGGDMPPFLAGCLALGLNSSAFISETLRASLSSVSVGQRNAAKALGLSAVATWLHILLPQALRAAIPPLTSEFSMLLRGTSVLSAITLVELTRASKLVMDQTMQPIEAFVLAGALYFCVQWLVSWSARCLERYTAAGSVR